VVVAGGVPSIHGGFNEAGFGLMSHGGVARREIKAPRSLKG